MFGIYIHVPFCKQRCIYCNFYSTTHGEKHRRAYVEALIDEWLSINSVRLNADASLRPTYISAEPVSSIYFGGGTPSVLPDDALQRLVQTIGQTLPIAPDAEVTLEANPDDITPQRVERLVRSGFNRISLGIQSFDDAMLGLLNRRHDGARARQAIADIRAVGIHNISGDLIYGLPGQSMDAWRRDLDTMLDQGVTHLSAYALSYEEGTPLYNMRASDKIKEVDEETSLAMYRHLMYATAEAGMVHYEISNFARPGYEARHNSSYWQGAPYLGLGAGAHSFDGRQRRWINAPDLEGFLAAHQSVSPTFVPPHEEEVLTPSERYDEIVMTALRTAKGVCLDDVGAHRDYLLKAAAPFVKSGQLECTASHLRLTREGIFISDYIIAELMLP